MRFETVEEWLAWQETLHPSTIELGLERLGRVLASLGLTRPAFPVITVAGTNGKGSSVAILEAALRAAGYHVGAYTSPHLLRYNERVRIGGQEVSDADLCSAFDAVDRARGDVSLTYFEFGTLAAFWLFARAGLDIAVLEVGMGGRLDAVNAWDPTVALVTAVDVDHAAWLGSDREAIGREKAGIFRAGRPAVVSDPSPPCSLIAHAEAIGAPLYRLGHEYDFRQAGAGWAWRGTIEDWAPLPPPSLPGRVQRQNAAGAAMVLELLRPELPVGVEGFATGLQQARNPGRLQTLPGPVPVILDVAHNPQAAAVLAEELTTRSVGGRTLAVFAALADKDLPGILGPLRGSVDRWFVAGLAGVRGSGPQVALAWLADEHRSPAEGFETVAAALAAAHRAAATGDRIVIFGSFHTVAEALSASV